MLLLIVHKCGCGFGGRKIFILNEQQIVLHPVSGLWWLRFACVVLLWGDRARSSLHTSAFNQSCKAEWDRMCFDSFLCS